MSEFGVSKTDSNMVAIKKFFGFKVREDGSTQTLKEFSDEVKALSVESQQEIGDAIRETYGGD